MNWKRIICLLTGHEEEVWKQQSDHRHLIWVCKRCDTVTRSMKLKQREMRAFRKVKVKQVLGE